MWRRPPRAWGTKSPLFGDSSPALTNAGGLRFRDADHRRSDGWTNSSKPVDVNGDNVVSPVDALILINFLNQYGSRMLNGQPAGPPYLDVNGDQAATPMDVLLVINSLNVASVGGEGEAAGGKGDRRCIRILAGSSVRGSPAYAFFAMATPRLSAGNPGAAALPGVADELSDGGETLLRQPLAMDATDLGDLGADPEGLDDIAASVAAAWRLA